MLEKTIVSSRFVAIFSAASSTQLVQPIQVDVQVSVDNAAKTAIFQYLHDAQILEPQAHPNLQNDLAWYIADNLKDHPQMSLAHVIAHLTLHPEVSE